ncbi:Vimentin type intermediate filament associated [Paragonimus skrjabini miyazakii]|uniref:Vimentin type intermediate filament associated n=1 Tax=Paragonimus skrjabini miyazakii TaxID=59628 RepID=A0A8S9YKX4_9TREM|nr:Vimentin type intermediate filament associated [Paragonimus skrjabini miyazakii]
MWFGSGQSKTSIEEANKHLMELYKKIADLEDQLRKKTHELEQKEADFDAVMREVHEKRQLELKDLNSLIYQQNLKLMHFEKDLSSRDTELQVLRKRCRMFDEVLRYKATLGKLTITMEQAEQYARLTSNARDYTRTYPIDTDCVNTDPAPLMIRDVAIDDKPESEVSCGPSVSDLPNGFTTPKLLRSVTNGAP